VQVGENHLSQVAQRLGVNLATLVQSNPQITDPGKIQVGQEVRVPTSVGEQAMQTDLQASTDSDRQAGLPPLPLGDPLAKSFGKARLDGSSLAPRSFGDVFGKGQLMRADSDGTSSGTSTAVSKSGVSGLRSLSSVKALKSPDIGLKLPSDKDLKRLNQDLQSAVARADAAEKKAEAAKKKAEAARAIANSPAAVYPKDMLEADKAEGLADKATKERDDAYAAVDTSLQQVVDTFGIGREGATGLSYNPSQNDLGDTATTASTISRDALRSPSIAASVILHESNHARRNQELADAGIDRGKFGTSAEEIYSALTEMEGDQLEIKNAKTLGTDAKWVKGAENLRQAQITRLTVAGAGKDVIECAKNGRFDEALKLFRQHLSESPQSHKYVYK